MNEELIKRINELSKKSKTEGLTAEEMEEQAQLRKSYLKEFRENLRSSLNNVDVALPDGTVKPLTELKKKP